LSCFQGWHGGRRLSSFLHSHPLYFNQFQRNQKEEGREGRREGGRASIRTVIAREKEDDAHHYSLVRHLVLALLVEKGVDLVWKEREGGREGRREG